ncbi:MAG: FAD-dependent oxidoreductase [Pseudomonadota bacterium]
MTDIAIIGAGLAGLTLANALRGESRIVVFEKSRGIGGRMATRYAGDYEFDHGAQYFTASSERFRAFLSDKIAAGLIAEWPAEVARIGGGTEPAKTRYVAAPRMNALCKAMAEGVEVRRQAEIARIERGGDRWRLVSVEDADLGTFDWVVSTAPAPQSAKLLPEVFSGHAAIERTVMTGCFAVMLGFETPVDLPWPMAKGADGEAVGTLALNSAKPGRPAGCSVLIQSSNAWAEAHLEDDRETVSRALIAAASEVAGVDLSRADHTALHRWRYAATQTPAGADCLLDADNRLAACGDWRLGGRVEAAFTSADRLGAALLGLLG